jgi:hypothetical protein
MDFFLALARFPEMGVLETVARFPCVGFLLTVARLSFLGFLRHVGSAFARAGFLG